MLRRLINIETHAGEPISAGDVTIIPLAKSLRLMIPGIPTGLIWNRPIAIVARTVSGDEHVIPVRDPTRRAVLSIWGAVCGSTLFTLVYILRRRVRNNRKEKLT